MIRSVDLFCGAGGLTTGLALALEDLIGEVGPENVEHLAINHWGVAIETHQINHPWARHINRDIEAVKPRDAFPEGHLDLLAAAPECTYHSVARGGKPTKDQKRMQPWLVLPWIQELRPKNVLIENVPEFRGWCPVDEDGNRVKERKGDTYDAFLQAIRSLGYAVDDRVLNAADYGDPTTRKRLFIVARRDKRPVFPLPTHSNEDDELPDWRPASSVINWDDPGESIWPRDVPLVQTTMQRIAEGLRRYADDRLEPFADAVASLGKQDVKQLQKTAVPVDEVTPELIQRVGNPFLVKFTSRQSFALAVPYLLGQHGGSRPRPVDDPAMTIATGGAISKIEPEAFVLPRNGWARGLHSNPPYKPGEQPLHTVTASNHDGHLVRPCLVPFYGERQDQDPRTHDVDDPLPTVPASKSPAGVAQPYLVEYYGNGGAKDLEEPMPTQTTRDRFALVTPELCSEEGLLGLDIRFRMLQPRELARAMGFPDSYQFAGNKTETIRQIGNAVCVGLAKQLCHTLLTDETEPIVPPQPADNPSAKIPEVAQP